MSKSAADIVIFACNWDGLSCVEAAAQMGLNYPVSVKLLRVSCLSRVHSALILKAFELGADGVMLLACETGNCHFDIDAGCITQEYEKTRQFLELLGLGSGRLVMARIPRGAGSSFVSQLIKFISEIEQKQSAGHAGISNTG